MWRSSSNLVASCRRRARSYVPPMMARSLHASAAMRFPQHTINRDVIITCAVTGSGDTCGTHPDIPKSPKEIADACIEAGEAGAAIAHLHVREPVIGTPSRKLEYYTEVVERIRESSCDVVINVTCGMGGDMFYETEEDEDGNVFSTGESHDMVSASLRLEHIEVLKPEICSLDCGSLNFGDGMYGSTAPMLREMAERITAAGVKPELECFEIGHTALATQLWREGLLQEPLFYQFALGIPWGATADTSSLQAMLPLMAPGSNWAAFGISRNEMPMVAQSMLLGGHVRVGLEDNLYLGYKQLATNGELVEHAVGIVESLGGKVLGPDEARAKLGLRGTQ